MELTPTPVAEVDASSLECWRDELHKATQPRVLRGLVASWPIVQRAQESATTALQGISQYYNGKPVSLFLGEAGIDGRFFYNEDMTGFNFLQMEANLNEVFGKLLEFESNESAPAFYVGSTSVDYWLPGFRNENDLDLQDLDPLFSIWIGNRSRVAAHFDFPDNIACCVAGHRRFTLFPPEQLENLYIGPLDLTPAGQQISLVDLKEPDLDRFPRFTAAMETAQVAELSPGDALFIPGMWWHHVEALDTINVLANYWWTPTPAYLGSPTDALSHAMLSIKSLSPEQRQAWRTLFDHYVFDVEEGNMAHIPAKARGRLGDIDTTMARRLRAELLNKLKQ